MNNIQIDIEAANWISLRSWETEGKHFFYKNQHRIFFKKAGQGETLLLLHGFPTASWDWYKLWPSLIQHFQVVCLDFIGFGFSDKPSNYAYSLFDQAQIVEGLMKHLGIQSAHVLAHDYGDTVLQELLARQNQQVLSFSIKSGILLNGGIFMETTRPRFIQKALLSPFGFLLTPFINKSTLRSNFAAIFGPNTQASEPEIDAFYSLSERSNGRSIYPKLIQYIDERNNNRERWVQALQASKAPLRLIIGDFDPISGRNIADRYAELVPNPDVVLLENIGHYPQTEDPDGVLRACFDFWRR